MMHQMVLCLKRKRLIGLKKKYLSSYNDIVIEERNEFYAYKHWIESGYNENRCAGKKYSQEPYERFEWESYLTMNPDLSELKTEIKLFHHWITLLLILIHHQKFLELIKYGECQFLGL